MTNTTESQPSPEQTVNIILTALMAYHERELYKIQEILNAQNLDLGKLEEVFSGFQKQAQSPTDTIKSFTYFMAGFLDGGDIPVPPSFPTI
jgi:hypothetical protein